MSFRWCMIRAIMFSKEWRSLLGWKYSKGSSGPALRDGWRIYAWSPWSWKVNILLTGSNYSWFRLPGIYIYGRLKRVLLIRSHSRGRWFSAPVADLAWEWDAWRLSGIAVLSLPPIASTSGGRITPVLRNISLPRQPWPWLLCEGNWPRWFISRERSISITFPGLNLSCWENMITAKVTGCGITGI